MKIDGKTKVLAVFGNPVDHSLSPVMHNAVFSYFNWNNIYIPCLVAGQSLLTAVESIRELNFKGANITVPYKQAVIECLDEVSKDALLANSVNTILNKNGKLIGYSTDGIGFVRSLREEGKFDLNKKKVLVFGAGGSAYAIVYKLINEGIKSLVLINRSYKKALFLKNKVFNDVGYQIDIWPYENLNQFDFAAIDLLINTTSVGLKDEGTIIAKEFLNSSMFVYDIVYKQGGTRLIKDAREVGCRYLTGLSLLLYQGVESFRLWFSIDPPINIMRDELQKNVND